MPLTLTDRSVSRFDDRPLHRQLAAVVRDAIASGALRAGETLPSEGELASTVGISRTAVRDALDVLAGEGLIVKRSGTVTRVATPPPVRHMATSRYLDELQLLRSLGDEQHPPTSAFTDDHGITWAEYTVGAEYQEDQAGTTAALLELKPTARVLRRFLIKYVSGEPVQLQESVMPLDLVKGTPVADRSRQPWPGGTIAELFSIGLEVTRVVEEAQARVPTADERQTLELQTAAPVFEILRVFYVLDRPVEVSTVVCPAPRMVLRYETDLS